MRLSKITALTAIATLGATIAMAAPAQAAEHNGVVDAAEFGIYYSPGSNGSWVFDSFGTDADLRNNVFPGTSVNVDNNTASYRNRSTGYMYVYTGISWTGAMGQLPPGWVGDASPTFRNTISSIERSPGS